LKEFIVNDQVIIRAEDLRGFAGTLHSSNDRLVEVMSTLHTRLSALGETWRDDHYRQFQDAFDQASRSLNHFLDDSERYIVYLRQKADAVDRVNEVRVPGR
jgi:uncharacterized protein YukE